MGFRLRSSLWYPYLFQDPAFVARVKEKWKVQKFEYRAVADEYIEVVRKRIIESVYQDKILWPCPSPVNQDNHLTFDETVEEIRKALVAKISWMEVQIENL